MYVALALLSMGVTTLVASDDLLAAFACGTAFAWDDWWVQSDSVSSLKRFAHIDLEGIHRFTESSKRLLLSAFRGKSSATNPKIDWLIVEDSNFSSTIDLLVNCTIFIYLGATIPFAAWSDATLTLTPWRLSVLAILILLLRRIPAMLVLHRVIPDIKTFREGVFAAHFGPMG